MSHRPYRPEDAATLLAEALRDPFEDFDLFHVTKWFRLLREGFPLLSFQVQHYAAVQDDGVPRIEPLRSVPIALMSSH